MDTISRGNLAEGKVAGGLLELGARLLIPFGEGHAYDLVVDLGTTRFVRVQCKAARRRGDVLVFNSRSTDHGRGRVSYRGRADLFGVYSRDTQDVYLVPVELGDGFEINLRLRPTRNNQRRFVRYAADYELSQWSLERLSEPVVQYAPGADTSSRAA